MVPARTFLTFAILTGFIGVSGGVHAQVKPHTSGHPAYNEPGRPTLNSGFKFPNRPRHHRYHPEYQHRLRGLGAF